MIGQSTNIIILKNDHSSIACHKALLTCFSDYFRAALDGSFAEANSSDPLAIDPAHTFETLMDTVSWLYTGTFLWTAGTTSGVEQLMSIYLFADQYLMAALKTCILELLTPSLEVTRGTASKPPPCTLRVLRHLAENLPTSDELCHLLAKSFAGRYKSVVGRTSEKGLSISDMPPSFLALWITYQSNMLRDAQIRVNS